MNRRSVSIIVPVYADWSSLRDCVNSLKQFVEKCHTVLLVNDSGPEADELEEKINKEIAGHENFKYYRNSTNLGFLKTCNRAVFELDKTHNDILLLNSDTKVTTGFLNEMLAVIYSEPKIGAVSPRTNNATICTVPLSAMSQKGIEPEKSYRLFIKLKERLPRYKEVPTAHGFCMLIRREVINKYGLFDEVFGKGYGEENDFCMRIMEHGYKSVLANCAYVFHLEARSFTIERKSKLIESNLKILRQRWPEYKRLVDKYISEAIAEEELNTFKKIIRQSSGVIKKVVNRYR